MFATVEGQSLCLYCRVARRKVKVKLVQDTELPRMMHREAWNATFADVLKGKPAFVQAVLKANLGFDPHPAPLTVSVATSVTTDPESGVFVEDPVEALMREREERDQEASTTVEAPVATSDQKKAM